VNRGMGPVYIKRCLAVIDRGILKQKGGKMSKDLGTGSGTGERGIAKKRQVKEK